VLPQKIATRRLLLRVPLPADAGAIFAAYAQDSAVCRFLDWVPHESLDVTRRFLAGCLEAWNAGRRRPYVLADPRTNEAIGMLEARILSTTVDIGYVLARSRWGSGLMPEAVEALVSACLAGPEIFRVQALCDAENYSSVRVLEKCGFVCEGRLERYGIHPNISPEPRACFMYARVA